MASNNKNNVVRSARNRHISHPRVQNKLGSQSTRELINKRDNKVDRISKLPDQILIPILSRLSLKEAASSSLLSKRWTSLWKHVSVLNFDFDTKWDIETIWDPSLRYKSWVNRVLQSYRGYTVDQFRICFLAHRDFTLDLDHWFEFAIRRRVQTLELDVGPLGLPLLDYTVPDRVSTFIKTPRGLSCIKSLTNLYLNGVNVTGEIIEHFLSNSPLLQRLCVSRSKNLTHLHVEGPALRLRILELTSCQLLQRLHIFAPNLIFFKFHYGGMKPIINIKYAPSLVDVSALSPNHNAVYAFCSMLTPLSHLHTLTFAMALNEEGKIHPSQFPELTRLRTLTLKILPRDDVSLFDWITLVGKAPSLHHFSIQLTWCTPPKKRMIKAPNCKENKSLKLVEFAGFHGHCLHTQVANYLIQIAIALDKLIIDRHQVDISGFEYEFKESEDTRDAKKCALELEAKLPPGAKLVVI